MLKFGAAAAGGDAGTVLVMPLAAGGTFLVAGERRGEAVLCWCRTGAVPDPPGPHSPARR